MARSESPSISVSPCGTAGSDARCTVVWLRGEHDSATAASLVATIGRASRLDGADVVIDLSAVTFMSAATIGAIVESRNRLRSSGRSLAVRSPPPSARRLLELCRLAELVDRVPLHPTSPAATLGTGAEVVAIGPSGRVDRQAGRVTAHLDDLGPTGPWATDVHVEGANGIVDVDREGP